MARRTEPAFVDGLFADRQADRATRRGSIAISPDVSLERIRIDEVVDSDAIPVTPPTATLQT